MESEKSMTQNYDSVFLIGFGGPTKGCCRRYDECPGEAFCYVENIVGNRSGGRDRIEEVSEHYKHFNGVSPFVFFLSKTSRRTRIISTGKRMCSAGFYRL